MDALFVYIILFICSLFALVYSSFYFVSNKKSYFTIFMYLSLIASFVGKLYNLIFELSGGNSYLFNLGDLGTVTLFLFSSYAILTLRQDKMVEHHFSIYSLFIPLLIIILWFAMFLKQLRFEKMILSDMYLISCSLCTYLCISSIIDTKQSNNTYQCFIPLWIIITILNILSMSSEALWLIDDYSYSDIISFIIFIGAIICYILMPIFLERGSRQCKI